MNGVLFSSAGHIMKSVYANVKCCSRALCAQTAKYDWYIPAECLYIVMWQRVWWCEFSGGWGA